MFGKDDLKLLVDCAKRALEAEDRHLANCFKTRDWKGRERGICACWSERYYQFLIWSELMFSFPSRPVLEWEQHDLAFFEKETVDVPVAVAEIKLWGSDSGFPELKGIQWDISKLTTRGLPGVMLILTARIATYAKDNIDFLTEHLLGISQAPMETASFPISTEDEGDWEFAVIGFLVASEALPGSETPI